MTNRAEVVVDLAAIKANVAMLKAKAGVDLLAVVKADAYGHGLVPVAKAAIEGGANWLGVALLEEAIALRSAGITSPILAWLVPPGSDYRSAVENDIDLAVSSLKALDEIRAIAVVDGDAVDKGAEGQFVALLLGAVAVALRDDIGDVGDVGSYNRHILLHAGDDLAVEGIDAARRRFALPYIPVGVKV